MNNESLGDFESFQDFDDTDKKIKHPVVTFFHLVFRFLAILVYIFGGFSSFIGCFVSVVLLLSLDFWTVKNITGRIMVGLRWWNYVDDNGESKWVFEAGVKNGDAAQRFSSTESKIFWTGLVTAPLLWVLLFLVAIFRFNFKWLVLVIIGVSLTGSNLFGYLRCKMGKTDLSGAASGVANSYMRKAMLDNLMGIFKSTPVNSNSSTNLTV